MQNETMNLFNSNPKQCLQSFYDLIMKLEIQKKNNQFIGIFGAPKSASWFVTIILAFWLKLTDVVVTITDESPEHDLLQTVNEIDYLKLLSHGSGNHITHAHLIANSLTLRAIERLKIIPIVTRRNIADSLISLRHELEKQWNPILPEINRKGFVTTFFGPVSSNTQINS